MQIRYAETLVAVLHLVGLKSLIEMNGSNADWVLDVEALVSQSRSMLTNKQQFARITCVSDYIYVTTTNATNEDFYYLCTLTSGLVAQFLSIGCTVRGAIVRGPIYHAENFVIGPALARAYDLESTIAVHPRIVFASEIPISKATKFVLVDPDGVRYLDVMSPGLLYDFEGLFSLDVAIQKEHLIEAVQRLTNNEKDETVRTGQLWLLDFLGTSRTFP